MDLPPPAAPEGRQWWLQLQQQRTAARRRSGRDVAPPPGPPPEPAQPPPPPPQQQPAAEIGEQERKARRAALLRDSAALLRRMARGRPPPDADTGEAAPGPSRRPSSKHSAPALSRRNSMLTGIRRMGHASTAEDVAAMHTLLQGGLIGRAMAASAAWHHARQQNAAREEAARRLLRGDSLGSSFGRGSSIASSAGSSAGQELPAAGGGCAASALGQALHTLAEGQEEEGEEEEREAPPCPGGERARPPAYDAAAADALVSAFADAEVRAHVQGLLAALEAAPAESLAAAAAAAASAGQPRTSGPESAAASEAADPLTRCWGATRAPGDLPVRGYAPPPSRPACRVVAAREMARFYEQQQKSAGHHFHWLGLTAQAATGRSSDVMPMALQGGRPPGSGPAAAAPLPPHRSLKGAARKVRTLQHLLGGVQESKATAWAKQHAAEVEAGAAEELRARHAAATAAEEARAAAAAAMARRQVVQPGKGRAAGNAFAAVVQLAAQARQAAQAAEGGSAGGECPASPPVAGRQHRKPKLPPLSLQKLGQRWAKAAASSAAAGEQSARARRQAAEAERLHEQWVGVQGRLPAE